MVRLLKENGVLSGKDRQMWLHNDDKVLCYEKGDAVFVFNLHPEKSYTDYRLPMCAQGKYRVVMSTDDFCFGGQGRIYHQDYETQDGKLSLYLPSRTALVLKKL